MADDKHAGRAQERRPSDDRRFVGPAGAVFVPHPLVDEDTIAVKVASGEWTLLEEQAPKKSAAKRSPKK
jgi:hypothetical protein